MTLRSISASGLKRVRHVTLADPTYEGRFSLLVSSASYEDDIPISNNLCNVDIGLNSWSTH
jgi:hypothetical protein